MCRRIADVVYFRMLSSSHSMAGRSVPSMLVDLRTAWQEILDRPSLLLLVHDLRPWKLGRIRGLRGSSGNDFTCCRRQRGSFPFCCNQDFVWFQMRFGEAGCDFDVL